MLSLFQLSFRTGLVLNFINQIAYYQGVSIFSLKVAVQAVQEGRMSFREAAKAFGVKRGTISNYVKKSPSSMEVGFTGHSLVTPEEERDLIRHIKMCGVLEPSQKRGNKKEVRKYIHEYLCNLRQDPNLPEPSMSWMTRFCHRNPDLFNEARSNDDKECSGEVLAMTAATMAKGIFWTLLWWFL